MQVTTSLGSFEFSHDPAATRVNGRPVVRKTTLFLDFAREEGHVKFSDGFGSRVCETREAPALAAHLRRCWDLQTNDRIPARDLPGIPHAAQPELQALRREFPDLQPVDGEW